MPPPKPLIWKAYDAAEKLLAPRLEDAVRSGLFLGSWGIAARTRSELARGLEARSRRLWHLLNLPAASDVVRVSRQLSQLDREVRRVSATLERAVADDRQSVGQPEISEDPGRAVTRSAPRDS